MEILHAAAREVLVKRLLVRAVLLSAGTVLSTLEAVVVSIVVPAIVIIVPIVPTLMLHTLLLLLLMLLLLLALMKRRAEVTGVTIGIGLLISSAHRDVNARVGIHTLF